MIWYTYYIIFQAWYARSSRMCSQSVSYGDAVLRRIFPFFFSSKWLTNPRLSTADPANRNWTFTTWWSQRPFWRSHCPFWRPLHPSWRSCYIHFGGQDVRFGGHNVHLEETVHFWTSLHPFWRSLHPILKVTTAILEAMSYILEVNASTLEVNVSILEVTVTHSGTCANICTYIYIHSIFYRIAVYVYVYIRKKKQDILTQGQTIGHSRCSCRWEH